MKYIVVASLLISAAPLFASNADVEKPKTQPLQHSAQSPSSSQDDLVFCPTTGNEETEEVAKEIFFQICREQTALSGKPKDKDRLSEEDRERAAAIKKQKK